MRYIFIVFLVIVGLIGIFLLILSLPPGEHYIKNILEKELSAAIYQKVTIGSVKTDLFWKIRLRDVNILDDTTSAPGDTILHIENIAVDYRLWRLLLKEVSIKSVRLNTVSIRLRRDPVGDYNLAILDSLSRTMAVKSPAKTGKSAYRIILQSALIDNLSANYVDKVDSLSGNINNGNVDLAQVETKDNYSFSIGVETVDLDIRSFPIKMSQIACEGKWLNSTIVINSLKSDLMNMKVDGEGQYTLGTPATVQARLELSGVPDTLLDLLERAYEIPRVSTAGTMDIKAQIYGAMPQPDIMVLVDLPSITAGEISANGGFVKAGLVGDSLYLDSLYLAAFDGGIYANAFAILDSTFRAQGALAIKNIEIASLPLAISGRTPPIAGMINGQIQFAGGGREISGWTAKAGISTERLRYNYDTVPDFKIALEIDSGQADLNISQRFLTASSHLQMEGDSLGGNFSFDINNLGFAGVMIGQPELSGAVSAEGAISGSIKNPSIEGILNGYNIDYHNIPVDTFEAKFQFASQQFLIIDSRFSGRIDSIIPGSAPLDFDSLSGAFAYRGTLTGTLDSLKGRVDVVASDPAFDGYGLGYFDLTATIDGSRVDIVKGNAIKGTILAEIGGSYDIASRDGTFDVRINSLNSAPKLEKFEILNVPSRALRQAGELRADYNLSGQEIKLKARGQKLNMSALSELQGGSINLGGMLNFNLDFQGTITNPSGSITLLITDLVYRNPVNGGSNETMLDSIIASISLASNVLTLDSLIALRGGQSLYAAASTQLRKDGAGNYIFSAQTPVEGSIKAKLIDLNITRPFLPPEDSIQGFLTASLNWKGTISSPHPEGQFTIQDVKAVAYRDAPQIEVPLLIGDLKDSTLIVRADSARVLRNYFAISAKISPGKNKRINTDIDIAFFDSSLISIQGYISSDMLDLKAHLTIQDISVFGPFLASIDSLSGNLSADLTIAGSPSFPDVNGRLLAHEITVHPVGLKDVFRNAAANISFTRTDVSIDTLYTEFGRGRISISGTASHEAENISALDLTLTVDSTNIEIPGMLTVSIPSANINYKGRGNSYLLDGDINLSRGRLTYNFDYETLLPWVRGVERIKPPGPDIIQNTNLNVEVHGGDSLWVVNNLANMRLGAALTVVGTPASPNFTGQMRIDEGYLIYLDRKFQVTEGTIYSGNALVFNPEINFSSEATVTNYQGLQSSVYTITLGVTGRLDSLRISLLSDPPLSKPDIVSLLTLGATTGQLTGQEPGAPGSGAGNVLIERAGTLSSQVVTGLFSGGLESTLGLKSVSVQGNLFNPTGPGGAQLSATKMVSPKVAITYSTNIGHLNNNSVALDYILTNHISLLGETDQVGSSSISVQYHLRFK